MAQVRKLDDIDIIEMDIQRDNLKDTIDTLTAIVLVANAMIKKLNSERDGLEIAIQNTRKIIREEGH